MSLTQTEKDLKAEVAQWETDFGRPFIIDGCRYLDGIDEQWEALKREKEEQKEMRVRQYGSMYIIIQNIHRVAAE